MEPFSSPTPQSTPDATPPAPVCAPHAASRCVWFWVIAAVLIIIAGLWYLTSGTVTAPTDSPTPMASEDAALDAELEAIEELDIDAELQGIDSELDQL